MSAIQKALAEIRGGVHKDLRRKSEIEKKRRAKQAAALKAKKAQEKEEADKEVVRLNVAVSRQATPIMAHIKKIVDYAQSVEREVGLDEIQRELKVDVPGIPKLLEALRNNPRLAVEEAGDLITLRYRSRHAIKDRDGLLQLVRAHPDGIHQAELLDSYRGVMLDIRALVQQGLVMQVARPKVLSETGKEEHFLFPWDERFNLQLDKDVVAAYHRVAIPEDPAELDRALEQMGFAVAPRRTSRRKAAKQEKKRKKAKRRRFDYRTNIHMAQLEEKGPLQ